MSIDRTKRATSVSVIVGTLLVPLSAVAALLMASPGGASSDTPPASTIELAAPATVGNPAVSTSTAADSDDLASACGPDGLQLVALEADGSITDVQQAALDALREVCDQEGMPLPGKSVPDPVVETVILAGAAPASAPTTTPTTVHDGDDDGEYEDDEHEEEDEYEDDDHDEDDDEDDDHDDHEDDDRDEDDD